MTVQKVNQFSERPTTIDCKWFAGTELQEGRFYATMLVEAEEANWVADIEEAD